jgi:hypothetical protein
MRRDKEGREGKRGKGTKDEEVHRGRMSRTDFLPLWTKMRSQISSGTTSSSVEPLNRFTGVDCSPSSSWVVVLFIWYRETARSPV